MIDRSKRQLFGKQRGCDGNLPWLKQPQQFSDLCTQCGKCITACETNIIAKGDGGFPSIDFDKGECTFCYKCAESCPEALFLDKHTTPWNKKASVSDPCLAKHGVDCRVCEETCEPFAIRFKPQLGSVAQPQIQTSDCTGCGACVASCPTKAISVGDIPIVTT